MFKLQRVTRTAWYGIHDIWHGEEKGKDELISISIDTIYKHDEE
jgi:hypothetical protein